MSFTYETEPTTSYAKDRKAGVFFWGDTNTLWSDISGLWATANVNTGIYGEGRYGFVAYGSLGTWGYDNEGTTNYTNDIKP